MGRIHNFVNLVWLTALIGSRGSLSLTSAAQTPRRHQFHHLNINNNNRGQQQQHFYHAQQYLEQHQQQHRRFSSFSFRGGGAATLSAVTSSASSTDGGSNTTEQVDTLSRSSSSPSIFNAGEMVVPDPGTVSHNHGSVIGA
jgi:hypothetical protein